MAKSSPHVGTSAPENLVHTITTAAGLEMNIMPLTLSECAIMLYGLESIVQIITTGCCSDQ